jgi:hypothetical protein
MAGGYYRHFDTALRKNPDENLQNSLDNASIYLIYLKNEREMPENLWN